MKKTVKTTTIEAIDVVIAGVNVLPSASLLPLGHVLHNISAMLQVLPNSYLA